MSSSIVVLDLGGAVTPAEAVSRLAGHAFKRGERRMKRYTSGGRVAEACADGPLRCYALDVLATLDVHETPDAPSATLVSRRYLTLLDFPWTTEVDSEGVLTQHVTHVTHRVLLICEAGAAASASTVRLEWDFASGKRPQDARVADDHAERVDYVRKLLGADGGPPAALLLKRLRAAAAK